METAQIILLLVEERDRLNRAIDALQGPQRRRGRPAKNPVTPVIAVTQPKKRGRRFSAAQRKKQAEKMKAFWAAKKQAEAKRTVASAKAKSAK
jgi:hypothetical protein